MKIQLNAYGHSVVVPYGSEGYVGDGFVEFRSRNGYVRIAEAKGGVLAEFGSIVVITIDDVPVVRLRAGDKITVSDDGAIKAVGMRHSEASRDGIALVVLARTMPTRDLLTNLNTQVLPGCVVAVHPEAV